MARKFLRTAAQWSTLAELGVGPLSHALLSRKFNCDTHAAPIWLWYRGPGRPCMDDSAFEATMVLQPCTQMERQRVHELCSPVCLGILHDWRGATVEHLRQTFAYLISEKAPQAGTLFATVCLEMTSISSSSERRTFDHDVYTVARDAYGFEAPTEGRAGTMEPYLFATDTVLMAQEMDFATNLLTSGVWLDASGYVQWKAAGADRWSSS